MFNEAHGVNRSNPSTQRRMLHCHASSPCYGVEMVGIHPVHMDCVHTGLPTVRSAMKIQQSFDCASTPPGIEEKNYELDGSEASNIHLSNVGLKSSLSTTRRQQIRNGNGNLLVVAILPQGMKQPTADKNFRTLPCSFTGSITPPMNQNFPGPINA